MSRLRVREPGEREVRVVVVVGATVMIAARNAAVDSKLVCSEQASEPNQWDPGLVFKIMLAPANSSQSGPHARIQVDQTCRAGSVQHMKVQHRAFASAIRGVKKPQRVTSAHATVWHGILICKTPLAEQCRILHTI